MISSVKFQNPFFIIPKIVVTNFVFLAICSHQKTNLESMMTPKFFSFSAKLLFAINSRVLLFPSFINAKFRLEI